MNKLIKKGKGFTLTELVIVIVIIAILAAILVPAYAGYVNRSKETNDTALVKMLNDALLQDEVENGQCKTFAEVVEVEKNAGFLVSTLAAKSKDNTLVWNQCTNRFYLANYKNGIYSFTIADGSVDPKNYNGKDLTTLPNYYTFWKIDGEICNSDYGFSTYLTKLPSKDGIINTTKGIDAGEVTAIATINYNNDGENAAAQDVVIRSNSVKTNLIVNAPKDTVKHYGVAGSANLISVNTSSYHEFGKVPVLEVSKGRIVLEEGSEVPHIHITTKVDSISSEGVISYNDNTFDEVIVSLKNGQETPDFTRNAVQSIPSSGTLVVEVEKNDTDSDFIWLYQQGVIQQIRVSDSSTSLGTTTATSTSVDNETYSVALDLANNLAGGKTWDTVEKDENNNIIESNVVVDTGISSADKEDFINDVINEESIDMGIDEYDYWIDVHSDSFAGGNGTQESPYLISNGRELSRLAYLLSLSSQRSSYKSAYYELTCDIDLSGKCWTPISGEDRKENRTTNEDRLFTGCFDGKEYTITGLTNNGLRLYDVENTVNDTTPMDADGEYAYGLFGTVGTCTIKNINFAKVAISVGTGELNSQNQRYVGDSVGTLVGATVGNSTTIENVHVLSGSIKGYDATAGIIGRKESGILYLTNCSNAASVTAVRRSGGIVGYVGHYSYYTETIDGVKTVTVRQNGATTTLYVKFVSCSNSGDITSLGVSSDFEDGGNSYYGACAIAHTASDSFDSLAEHISLRNPVDGFTNTGKIKTIITENNIDTNVYYFYNRVFAENNN